MNNDLFIIITIGSTLLAIFVCAIYSMFLIRDFYRMKKRKKFIRLLKELGIYREYITNLKKMNIGWRNRYKSFFLNHDPEDYVIEAFNSTNTKQGYTFWRRVDIMWKGMISGDRPSDITQFDKDSLKYADNSRTYGRFNKK